LEKLAGKIGDFGLGQQTVMIGIEQLEKRRAALFEFDLLTR